MTEKNVGNTLTFRTIDTDVFEHYFMLDSPGWYIAKDADEAGEIATPLDALETVCVVNKLYMSYLRERIESELEPFGEDKVERYFELQEPQASDFLIGQIGKERVATVVREVMKQTRRAVKIGGSDEDPRLWRPRLV